LLTPLRLLPGQPGSIALILLAIVLILICPLVSVVHAATDGPARRTCAVIRALRGSPDLEPTMRQRTPYGAQPDPPAPPAAGQLRHPAARAGRQGQSQPRARGAHTGHHGQQRQPADPPDPEDQANVQNDVREWLHKLR
jgi:hypothetical protein